MHVASRHKGIIALFAAFILLCGVTHALHAVLQLLQQHFLQAHPAATPQDVMSASDSLSVAVLCSKALTALVSVVTCVVLFVLIPHVLAGIRYVRGLEEGLRRKVVELDEARAAAEAATGRQREFMAFLCHELRNPLHIITANTDFLLESSSVATSSTSTDSSFSEQLLADVNDLPAGTSNRCSWRGSTPSHQAAEPSPYLEPSPAHLLPPPLSQEQRQYVKIINHAAELMVSICNDVLDIAKLEWHHRIRQDCSGSSAAVRDPRVLVQSTGSGEEHHAFPGLRCASAGGPLRTLRPDTPAPGLCADPLQCYQVLARRRGTTPSARISGFICQLQPKPRQQQQQQRTAAIAAHALLRDRRQ